MGCNYYLLKDPCPTCGHAKEKLHIGKSSEGWCFSLHVDPDEGVNSLEDWKQLWMDYKSAIVDEYGETISPKEMERVITKRLRLGPPMEDKWYEQNCCIRGPNGLARHADPYCVGHGDGPWDYITGRFS